MKNTKTKQQWYQFHTKIAQKFNTTPEIVQVLRSSDVYYQSSNTLERCKQHAREKINHFVDCIDSTNRAIQKWSEKFETLKKSKKDESTRAVKYQKKIQNNIMIQRSLVLVKEKYRERLRLLEAVSESDFLQIVQYSEEVTTK